MGTRIPACEHGQFPRDICLTEAGSNVCPALSRLLMEVGGEEMFADGACSFEVLADVTAEPVDAEMARLQERLGVSPLERIGGYNAS